MSFDSILPIALLVIAVSAYTLHTIYIFRLARETEKWPTTQGIVTNAAFGERRDGDNVRFSANVKYRYSVGGRSFESTTLSIGPSSYSRYSWAVDALRGIHKGESVDVYYDPEKPSRAVLVTGYHAEFTHTFVGCLIGWVAVIFMAIKMFLISH